MVLWAWHHEANRSTRGRKTTLPPTPLHHPSGGVGGRGLLKPTRANGLLVEPPCLASPLFGVPMAPLPAPANQGPRAGGAAVQARLDHARARARPDRRRPGHGVPPRFGA